MQRPRFKRTVEVFREEGGNISLTRPSVESTFHVERPSEQLADLLLHLDGSQSLIDLEGQFGAETMHEAIGQLQELDLIEDAADDDLIPAAELARFDRQLRYFSDLGSSGQTPSKCQIRLREATVAVLGVGGLGGRAAWELACCGVGELRLVDGDEVEASNLNRQILYTEADIGAPKAHVAASRLRSFNPGIRVDPSACRLESEAELAAFIDGADMVIDAADWPARDIEQWCNSACFKAGIPYITMSHFLPVARVGPLYVPGVTGCFACQETAYRREYPRYDLAMDQRRGVPSPAATIGPACGLIGGLVGLEVMHYLTGLVEPATLGTAHVYNLETLEVTRKEVVPDPDCEICARQLVKY